jgi:uncharacterized protein YgbK (DUF1537 family)
VIRYLVADDLTGAADGSVAFCARREVEVSIRFRPWDGDGGELRVLDTETRSLPPADAAATLRVACQGLGEGVFKKVDSTLRGPVAAELEAVRAALGRTTIVLAPSLPAQFRRVVGGRLVVDGGDQGSVAELLGTEAPLLGVESLESETLPRLVLLDAETEADLERIALACDRRPGLLPAGSAGLAAAFARLEGPPRQAYRLPRVDRLLVAVASRQPATRLQLEALRQANLDRVSINAVPEAAGGDPVALATRLAAEVAHRLATSSERTAVLATGGDAALAICRELGTPVIRPRAELLPGVVASETSAGGPLLVTKAGGFGEPELLVRIARLLLGSGDG